MGSKLTVLDAVVELETGNGTDTYTDISDEFNQASVSSERDDLDSGVFGDRAARHEKGIFKNEVSLNMKPDADMVTLTDLMDFYIADDTRNIKIRLKNEAASATNPMFVCPVHCTKLPLGADRGSILEQGFTWPIDGAFEVWFDPTGTSKKTFG